MDALQEWWWVLILVVLVVIVWMVSRGGTGSRKRNIHEPAERVGKDTTQYKESERSRNSEAEKARAYDEPPIAPPTERVRPIEQMTTDTQTTERRPPVEREFPSSPGIRPEGHKPLVTPPPQESRPHEGKITAADPRPVSDPQGHRPPGVTPTESSLPSEDRSASSAESRPEGQKPLVTPPPQETRPPEGKTAAAEPRPGSNPQGNRPPGVTPTESSLPSEDRSASSAESRPEEQKPLVTPPPQESRGHEENPAEQKPPQPGTRDIPPSEGSEETDPAKRPRKPGDKP